MNVGIDTTCPTDGAIVEAMRSLEGAIYGLSMMAEIMGDILDDNLVEIDFETGEKRGTPAAGKNLHVVLTRGQIEQISFAWNDVIGRSVKLQKAFIAALDGKEVPA